MKKTKGPGIKVVTANMIALEEDEEIVEQKSYFIMSIGYLKSKIAKSRFDSIKTKLTNIQSKSPHLLREKVEEILIKTLSFNRKNFDRDPPPLAQVLQIMAHTLYQKVGFKEDKNQTKLGDTHD